MSANDSSITSLDGPYPFLTFFVQGPDGTNGFAEGWTTRTSQFKEPQEELEEPTEPETLVETDETKLESA